MNTVTQEELFQLGSAWIANNRLISTNDDVEIDADTSLLDGTIIDSLAFVELIHFIEDTAGDELDLSKLDMDSLTLRGLCACLVVRPSADGDALPA